MSIKKKVYDIKPPRNWHNVSRAKSDSGPDSVTLKTVAVGLAESKAEPINTASGRAAELFGASKNKSVPQNNFIIKKARTFSHAAAPAWIKKILVPASILIALVAVYFLGFVILPKATVNINTIKTPGVYNARVFIATPAASEGMTQVDTLLVPAELYSVSHTESQEILSTGNKIGGSKATVKLQIYNNYSTSPQPLVAGTRFQSESGKIFRLDSRLVVPPAKLDNQNKLTPVYIEAMATADEAGDSYNIPAGKFTIPGFNGTPKFEGFYATSKTAASGGSLGGLKSVTADDLKNGEAKVGKDLLSNLDNALKTKIPSDYKILEGAKNYKMQQIESTAKVDQVAEKFTITMSGEAKVIAFKESDLLAIIKAQLQKQVDSSTDIYGEPSLEYTINKADFTTGSLTGQVKVNWSSRPLINEKEIIANLKGKSIKDAKAYLESIPNMNKTSVKLWPGYIQKIPVNERKINVTID